MRICFYASCEQSLIDFCIVVQFQNLQLLGATAIEDKLQDVRLYAGIFCFLLCYLLEKNEDQTIVLHNIESLQSIIYAD